MESIFREEGISKREMERDVRGQKAVSSIKGCTELV